MPTAERIEWYRSFCREHTELPIFLQDWWLDAVCGLNNWDVAISVSDQKITGVLPYYLVKKSLLRQIVMPPLTQHMGPWLIYPPGQKYTSRLSFEKSTMADLISQLPNVDRFVQNFGHHLTNWLPFYWKGFSQTTFYTYQITDLSDTERIWSNLRGSVRSDIRKAEKHLVCQSSESIDGLYQMTEQTYQRQGKVPPYTQNFLAKIHHECCSHQTGKIFYAVDCKNRFHAALYLIWDRQTAYYLIGGAHPELRSSGAQPFLVWNAIKFASEKVQTFDFEGSMHPAIERSFSAFGGVQTPYFSVNKIDKKWLKLLLAMK